MEIVVFGLNHKKAPIHIREKVSFKESQKEDSYKILKKSKFIREFLILSTCNRSEIIAVVSDIEKGINEIKNFYIRFFDLDLDYIEKYFYEKIYDCAVKHVFNVAAGLDSLVIGEDQILGQLREAHEFSLDKKATGPVLNKLIREAITTAKKIKRETKISENSLSISSIAVKFVEKIFDNLTNKKVLVIGVGKMSRIAIENLIYKGVKEIYVTNRTKGHAVDLSKKYREISVIDFKDRYKMIDKVDIIISSTSAPHYVLKKDEFIKHYKKAKKICIVDIALPRDVEPKIGELNGISLFELDELKDVADENYKLRIEAAKVAFQIIARDCIKFKNWYNCLPVFPVIEELKNYTSSIVNKELESFMKKINHLDEKEKEQIILFTNSLAKKLFKKPLLELKRAGENMEGKLYARITRELFGLSEKIK
ncbi:glutamyl-tRNA reductase [Caminicella sporogenes]|uniref:glutamyl-tRNA reductase n=1 Tax=Caminicella sporogenes TaxID=166485 RepID=UPI002540A721|nr:glutamyl-tRNA reductase [Caminicella sporogenes]WIF94955.1 glutamyl-tRNA reductase [Caminicella sporogenes]